MWKLLLLTLPLALSPVPSSSQDGEAVTQRYHECAEQEDRAGLVEVWTASPHLILYTIDADLEGSLKLIESSEEPDLAAVKALHERALFGALCAEEATGRPIFVEYASSFAGWTREQQLDFRKGQKAYGEARKALKEGDHEAAAAAGSECAALAEPLGDWWGTAMGFSAQGLALAASGSHDKALVPLSRARLIYHDLGLVGSEYANLRALIDSLVAAKRTLRARHAYDQAIALAKKLGDEKGLAELEAAAKALGE